MIIALLIFSVACGKTEKKSKSENFSLSSLQSSGIFMYAGSNNAYGGSKLSINCVDTGVTNSQKVQELNNFYNSMMSGNMNGTNFTIGNVSLTPNEMNQVLRGAIYTLQMGNPNSTYCPRQILSQI